MDVFEQYDNKRKPVIKKQNNIFSFFIECVQ